MTVSAELAKKKGPFDPICATTKPIVFTARDCSYVYLEGSMKLFKKKFKDEIVDIDISTLETESGNRMADLHAWTKKFIALIAVAWRPLPPPQDRSCPRSWAPPPSSWRKPPV